MKGVRIEIKISFAKWPSFADVYSLFVPFLKLCQCQCSHSWEFFTDSPFFSFFWNWKGGLEQVLLTNLYTGLSNVYLSNWILLIFPPILDLGNSIFLQFGCKRSLDMLILLTYLKCFFLRIWLLKVILVLLFSICGDLNGNMNA